MLIQGSIERAPKRPLLAFDNRALLASRDRSDRSIVFAFDRESVRRYGDGGRLHVDEANISKAAINPYLGREIPRWQELGLDPNKIYKLFRDPEELEKAAPTFNNLPLLSRHVEVSADRFPEELVIGTTGDRAEFASPFLQNSLAVWKGDAIKGIEADEKKELSSAYRYRADMTPGNYEGEKYDGVMRDIVGNHVALVKEGRAGSDVVVGDSMENLIVAKTVLSRKACLLLGAVAAVMQPKLAQDAKLDLTPIFAGVTSKNFKEKKPEIVKAIVKLADGKFVDAAGVAMANDEGISDVVALLDKLESVSPTEGKDDATEPNSAMPIATMPDDDDDTSQDEDPMMKAKEFAKSKMSADDYQTFDEMCAAKPAKDESPEEKEKREAAEKEKAAKDAAGPEMKPVTKAAMDEAMKGVAASVRATERGIQEALRRARPYVGELTMSFDSAEQVNRQVLKMLGVKGFDTIHESALPAMIEMQPLPGSKKPGGMAHDAAPSKGFAERFPGASRIEVIG